ncbi:MAG: DsbA family protein [Acidimicrobiia bacterium]
MTSFAVTWDYRCPFARNAHEHVVCALEGGADWEVRFIPFSLGQVHVEPGGLDVWDAPHTDSGLMALMTGTVVRDRFPDRFLAVHKALFALRHDQGRSLRDDALLAEVLTTAGVDAESVLAEVQSLSPLDTIRREHEAAAKEHAVWGVPTFIADGNAAFVRYMNRPNGDHDLARRTIDRTVGLLTEWPELNEFKHTSIPN